MRLEGSSGSFLSQPVNDAERPAFRLILAITATGIMSLLVVASIPEIRDEFGISSATAGWILAAAAAPGILIAPMVGMFADRYGRREVVVPCLLIFGVSGGLAAFSPSFPVLIFLRFWQGVGSAGLFNLAITIIGDHWTGTDRLKMIGRNSAVLTTLISIFPLLGGLLTHLGGWRLTFVPYWLALPVAYWVWRGLPKRRIGTSNMRNQFNLARKHLYSRDVIITIAMGVSIFILSFGLLLTVLPIYLKDVLEVNVAMRGAIIGLPGLAATCIALNLGRIRQSLDFHKMIFLGFCIVFVSAALMSTVASLAVVIIGSLAYGLGEGILIPTLQTAISGLAPNESRATMIATFGACLRAGQTAGPVVAGLVMQHSSARMTFALGALIAIFLAVIWLFSGPRQTV